MFADLRLGGSDNLDGLEIVRCARELAPATRIVVLTAYGHPAVAAQARRLGAQAVLSKPMRLPRLAQYAKCGHQRKSEGRPRQDRWGCGSRASSSRTDRRPSDLATV